jgi:two-component system, cell cycle response regulator DivK
VVEDQPDNRQIIRDMLAPTDYEITEVENGEEALAAITKQRPDLILMDIQLPIMDGYEATRRIKADASLRSIPIIAVTSYALSGEEKKARAVTIRRSQACKWLRQSVSISPSRFFRCTAVDAEAEAIRSECLVGLRRHPCTIGHWPSLIGRNVSSAGMLARSL